MSEKPTMPDPKIPINGWSHQERCLLLLDFIKRADPKSNWELTNLKRGWTARGEEAYLEGVLLAAAWFSGAISGGKVREMVRARSSDLDEFAVEQMLKWAEIQHEQFEAKAALEGK